MFAWVGAARERAVYEAIVEKVEVDEPLQIIEPVEINIDINYQDYLDVLGNVDNQIFFDDVNEMKVTDNAFSLSF